MSAKVLSFPQHRMKAEERVPEVVRDDGAPAAPQPPARGEQIIPKGEPLIRDPRVLVPMSVLDRMVGALKFYSHSGFDHGRIALAALAVPGPNNIGEVA